MTCLYWTFMSLCRDQTRQVLQMSGGRIVSYGKIADDFADAECPSVCRVHMNIHSRNVPMMYACVCVCALCLTFWRVHAKTHTHTDMQLPMYLFYSTHPKYNCFPPSLYPITLPSSMSRHGHSRRVMLS